MPDASATYKPDVVIVKGGASAIRSLSADGLYWTIDPNAPGAERLTVGTIAFVTGRCVGRVIAAQPTPAGLTVLLGPVQLTDIYQRLEIRVEDQPIDFAEILELPPPQLPGWAAPLRKPVDPFANWNLDNLGRIAPSQGGNSRHGGIRLASAQPVTPGIPNAIRVGMHTGPLNAHDGPGMTLEGDDQGTRLVAQAQFRMAAPKFEFSLKIFNDQVYVIAILKNAATLRMAFDAAVGQEFVRNYRWSQAGPALTIPLAGPHPFAIDLRQDVEVTTAFSAKSSSFGAGGTYRLNADLGVSYSAGQWMVHGPSGLTVESALVPNLTGVSFGPSGIVLRHELTLTAGLGAAGFTVGPVFVIHTALGVGRGSTIGIVQCREAALSMHARASVGYTIPRPVAEFVNFFLRLFRVSPIKDHASVATPWQRLFEPVRVTPGGQSCVPEAASRG